MKTCTLPRARILKLLVATVAVLVLAAALPAQSAATREFDIPSGTAAETLKLFGRQAAREIVFAPEVVGSVVTNAVKGELTPQEAIDRLLAETGLIATEDAKTGAFAVRKVDASASSRRPGGPRNGEGDFGQTVSLEAFVVSGLRGTLAKSLEMKRESDVVLDAVSAEDISAYPDTNIAESLQRISGVTINRTNGEGELVSIRGLSPQFTLVTAQGLTLSSTAINDDGNVHNGRAVSFDIFPSQLFAGATVAKTLSAETMDGGLSGAVDLKLPRPLAYARSTGVLSLQGNFNDLTKRTDPTGTFFWSHKWGDRFGVLVQGVHAREVLYAGIAEGVRWNSFNFPALNATGVEVARLPRVGEEIYDRERTAGAATVQFQPSPGFMFTAYGMIAKSKKDRSRVTLQGNLFGPVNPTALVLDNNQAVAATFGTGTQIRSGGDFNVVDTDSTLLGLTADVRLGEARVTARLSHSSSTFDRDVQALIAHAVVDNYSYDFRGDARYPVMSSTAMDFSDASAYTSVTNTRTRDVQSDDNLLADVSADLPLRGRFLRAVKAGVQYRLQERARNTTRANVPLALGPQPFVAVAGNTRYDYAPHAPAGVPRDFAAFDRSLVYEKIVRPSDSLVLPVLPSLTYTIEENIAAAYLQLDFASEANWRVAGNIGLRYARTEQEATGFSQQGALSVPLALSRSYDDFLPSMNVRAEVSDNSILRFSASRGITRPSLSDLAPSETVSAVNPTVTRGNPNLKPYLATQLDLAWEWYFRPEALISLALFHKRIDSLITTYAVVEHYVPFDPTRPAGDFIITTPINGDKATVNGLEASFQQPLTFLPRPFDALGILANVTLATSKSTSTVVTDVNTGVTREVSTRVQGQSPVSYNLVVYYDRRPIQLRLAYHWRDDYLILLLGTDEQRFKQRTGNLDLSFSWKATEKLTFFVEGLNLSSEDQYYYDRTTGRNIGFADYGRQLNCGVRMKF